VRGCTRLWGAIICGPGSGVCSRRYVYSYMWFLLLCGVLASFLCPRSYTPVEHSTGCVGCDLSCQHWQEGEKSLNPPRTGFLVVNLMPSDWNESAGVAFAGKRPSKNARGAYRPPPQLPIHINESPCWDITQEALPQASLQHWSVTLSKTMRVVQSHDLYQGV
jgi:hypothetical protein